MTTIKKKTVAIIVRGIVQGVGFRPFVYGCAKDLDLCGWVSNSGKGVEIILAGPLPQVDIFLQTLQTDPPPLARIDDIAILETDVIPEADDFVILESDSDKNTTLISPDTATCDDCIEDIFSPDNRRFLYPFTNCTNCGPRLTIIRKIPYDRPLTSMATFPMCAACKKEYTDPLDRRFHAQPNACPDCGPEISWLDSTGKEISRDNKDCLLRCSLALKQGKIVAIKGIGGFHLVANACSDHAVEGLHRRKNRFGKPLAIMAPTLERASEVGIFHGLEEELLTSSIRPIVLVQKQDTSPLSIHIAPGIREVGIMLPYTPLHHLLYAMPDCPDFLVMTSGNASSEPICTTNRDALERLAPLVDYFLIHNRDIVTRVDDSVVRVIRNRTQLIRRSRGYVPRPVNVPLVTEKILACGAELKNCFALSRRGSIFLSQHIGDLKGPANMVFFQESINYIKNVFEIEPEQAARDLHPDYLSSRYADKLDLPTCRVQHHHAHAAAIMAEHGLTEGLAVIFDGAGLGPDGTVWGGEFLAVQDNDFRRVGHLLPFQLPGGDRATREIWRLGLSLLKASWFSPTDLPSCLQGLQEIPREKRRTIAQLMEKNINSPLSSSIGRLFDGVASLLGVRQEVDFEGQAAMELETLAWQFYAAHPDKNCGSRYIPTIIKRGQCLLIDLQPLVHWLIEDIERGRTVAELAWFFHLWLVRSTEVILVSLGSQGMISLKKSQKILLGGGCFQNRMLLEFLSEYLEANGFTTYTGEQVPVNDGGIALGQLYVASLQKHEI